MNNIKKCNVENCNGEHYAKGYCYKHYQQIKRCGKIIIKNNRTMFDPNEMILYDDYAEIILYNSKQEEVARTLISLDKISILGNYKWHLNKNGYVQGIVDNKKVYLHRFLLNSPDDMHIDHINCDKLDNRNENLRVCTQQQNNKNLSKRKSNKSGVTGVSWSNDRRKWVASIQVNGRCINLGRFDIFEDAVKVRKEAEEKYFGEFKNKG